MNIPLAEHLKTGRVSSHRIERKSVGEVFARDLLKVELKSAPHFASYFVAKQPYGVIDLVDFVLGVRQVDATNLLFQTRFLILHTGGLIC